MLIKEGRLRTIIKQEMKKVLNEGSRTTTVGSGNNSTRWTPPKQERKLEDIALTGYEQIEFPEAEDPVAGGYPDQDSTEELHIDTGTGAAFNNKIRVERGEDGELYFVNRDDRRPDTGEKETVNI